MRKIVVVSSGVAMLGAAAAAALLLWEGNEEKRAQKLVVAEKEPAPPAKESALEQDPRLWRYLRSLQRRIDELEEGTEQAVAQPRDPEAVEAQPATETDEPEVVAKEKSPEELRVEEATRLAEYLETDSLSDPAWSRRVESELHVALDGEALQGSRVVSSQCRSKVCRIQLSHEDESASRRFHSEFMFQVSEDDFGGGTVHEEVAPTGERSTTVYLFRKGQEPDWMKS